MNEEEIKNRLDQQDKKLDEIFKSTEKTRRYLQIITWVTILVVVLPIIGLFFAIPSFINTYSSLGGLI